jgi:hypothetical protein
VPTSRSPMGRGLFPRRLRRPPHRPPHPSCRGHRHRGRATASRKPRSSPLLGPSSAERRKPDRGSPGDPRVRLDPPLFTGELHRSMRVLHR